MDDLIDRVLGGEDPRDVVDEVTSTGAIATYPKAMAIVHQTRSRKRKFSAQKPKLSTPTIYQSVSEEGRHRMSRCMADGCNKPPEKECIWADGRGRAWFCKKHYASWATKSKDIVRSRDVESGKVGKKYGVEEDQSEETNEVTRGPENWIHGVGGPQPGGFFWDVTNATSPGDGVQTPPSWPWSKKFRRKYGANTAFNKRPDPGKG